jgi:hypothetical protein
MSAETFIPAPTRFSSAGSAAGIHVGSPNRTVVNIRIISDEDGSMSAALTAQHVDALISVLAAARVELGSDR